MSCAPVNNEYQKKILKNFPNNSQKKIEEKSQKNDLIKKEKLNIFTNQDILSEIEIILPKINNKKITNNLINSFELSMYKKELTNMQLNINYYYDEKHLSEILNLKAIPGKIFVGTLNSSDAKLVKNYCKKGILFFSFASDKNLAGECLYLINFFPEDDLRALFNYFPMNSKIALLYPENYYGYSVNGIIDSIALKSNSFIINRASYMENLTNVRDAIKVLGKYKFRKNELSRQKKILENKKDNYSISVLKKIKKFETTGNLDFTHLIIADYGIRLLEVAPLLPFYDVDPIKIQFVGTGVWDDKVFFDEPSLQGAIFSGIEFDQRSDFFDDYYYIYKKKPIRTSTIPYDLLGILSYIINHKMTLVGAFEFLNNDNLRFDGIDGKFYFLNNVIFRELDILQIKKGKAKKLN